MFFPQVFLFLTEKASFRDIHIFGGEARLLARRAYVEGLRATEQNSVFAMERCHESICESAGSTSDPFNPGRKSNSLLGAVVSRGEDNLIVEIYADWRVAPSRANMSGKSSESEVVEVKKLWPIFMQMVPQSQLLAHMERAMSAKMWAIDSMERLQMWLDDSFDACLLKEPENTFANLSTAQKRVMARIASREVSLPSFYMVNCHALILNPGVNSSLSGNEF